MAFRWVAISGWVLWLAACGPGDVADTGADAGTEAGMDAGSDARAVPYPRSPDGEGYCCPVGRAECGCVPIGGFSESGECASNQICDALPSEFRVETDEHGCDVLRWGFGSCLGHDAGGPDAPDAGAISGDAD